MFLVSGDYEVQYRFRGLCPGRQDLANNHINPVIRSANLIVAPSHQPILPNHPLDKLPISTIMVILIIIINTNTKVYENA